MKAEERLNSSEFQGYPHLRPVKLWLRFCSSHTRMKLIATSVLLFLLSPFAFANEGEETILRTTLPSLNEVQTILTPPAIPCSGDSSQKPAAIILADSGNESSGGGTVIQVQGCPMLLDLYLTRPSLAQSSCQPGIRLPETQALKSIHLERVNSKDSEIITQAMTQLDAWKKNSPVVTGIIREALTHAPLFYTDYQIALKDGHYSIPAEMKSRVSPQDLKTVALYAKDFGILISKKDFDRLSHTSQIALVIHEALRHAQIQYGFHMSDASIQKITAALVSRGPEGVESLDSGDYADHRLLETIQKSRQKDRPDERFAAEACNAISPYRAQMASPIQNQLDALCLHPQAIRDIPATLKNLEQAVRERADLVCKHSPDANEGNLCVGLSKAGIQLNLAIFNSSVSALGDASAQGESSARQLGDATLNAKHSVRADAAIDEANRGTGWLTGSGKQINAALEKLVNSGLLKN